MKRFPNRAASTHSLLPLKIYTVWKQLPGLAVQRLMQQGYGFAGEGDWKPPPASTMKVMSTGLQGGNHLWRRLHLPLREKGNDLRSARTCWRCVPSIAVEEKPILDVQHLGIGGKEDPARLIFNNTQTGPAIVASLIDLGDHACWSTALTPQKKRRTPSPKLPVANALWKAQPDRCRPPPVGFWLAARTIPSSATRWIPNDMPVRRNTRYRNRGD